MLSARPYTLANGCRLPFVQETNRGRGREAMRRLPVGLLL